MAKIVVHYISASQVKTPGRISIFLNFISIFHANMHRVSSMQKQNHACYLAIVNNIDLLYHRKLRIAIEYEILGEGSQICHYCLRRKGLKSQLLAGEGSQISLF